jgi:hypothetical protein
MKRFFFIFLTVLTILSCTYKQAGFALFSQNELMKSWAWKTFVFIDEVHIKPIKLMHDTFYKNNNEKSIYEDDFFPKSNEFAIREQSNSIFEKGTTKK